MWQFFLSAWRSGFRSKGVQAIVVIGAMLVCAAYLAGMFSPRQPRTVALDVGFSGLRFSLVLLAVYWVQELVGREIERRTVVFALTYPVSRSAYILGRFSGIVGLLCLAALLLALLLWLAVLLSGAGYEQQFAVSLGWPYWLSMIGFLLDAIVVAAFTLAIASISTVPLLPVALGIAFAIAGKSLGPVMDYLAKGADGDKDLSSRYGPVVELIGSVLPDLSRLDWRAAAMYGVDLPLAPMLAAVVMAVIYAAIMVMAAALSFERREFL